MSLLLSVLLKTACPSAHHKLAIDALRFLGGASAEAWRDLLLGWHKPYLAGAKAPDDQFKDFRNHVLYVGERHFGGALASAREWFDKTAAALAARNWSDAAFAAGVLSHYVSEPFMPLNTRQSSAGNSIQLAVECSINRAYGQLQTVLDEDFGGYPAVLIPSGDAGMEQAMQSGAELAVQHYDAVLDHFDLPRAMLDPCEALDQELQDRLALCLGAAVVSFAYILERAIEQAAVEPPRREASAGGLTAFLKSPFRLLSSHTYDQITQRQLEAIHDELELTGRVDEALPEEQREVRRVFAEEVLHVSPEHLDEDSAVATGKLYAQGANPRYRPNRLRSGPAVVRTASRASQMAGLLVWSSTGTRPAPSLSADDEPTILRFQPRLDRASPIEDAPAITPKMAARLRAAAIDTLGDLVAADPEFLARRLHLRSAGPQTVMEWQAVARLCCQIPQLRGQEAQLLVAAGIRQPSDLTGQSPQQLVARLAAAVDHPERVTTGKGMRLPTLQEVSHWIGSCNVDRQARAA